MIVVAEHVSKYYGAHAAVSDLSFGIGHGEVVGLLGLNGAGKTTTLRILSGLLVPTCGRVRIAGEDMAEHPETVRARIGFLPDQVPVYPEMTVEKYLTFVAHLKGYTGNVAHAVDHALTATDLANVRHDVIATLSHGYQKRIGIAQAIVHHPALILLDEPTSGLDPVQIVHMRRLIRGLRGTHTVVVSSHLLNEIHALCDRIFVLREGRIEAVGTEAELAARVANTTPMRVEVRGAADTLVQALAQTPHVRRHHVQDEGGGIVSATIELDTDCREEMARIIVQAGLGLRRLERMQLELESIFLELTGTQTNTQQETVR